MSAAANIPRNRLFLFLFFVFTILDLILIGSGNDSWRFISKPLLMPCLLLFYILNKPGRMRNSIGNDVTMSYAHRYSVLIPGALFFSWVGDILLMFENRDPIFFLLGLSSFLVAHIFYILFFHRLKQAGLIKSKWFFLLLVVVYYTVLIALLYPFLNEMRVPVAVYGIVISFMLLLALHMFYLPNKMAGKYLALGAILFVISDSILAVNKFYQPIPFAGLLVMASYAAAQLLIVYGARD